MIDPEAFERIKRSLPVLDDAEPQMVHEFMANAYYARLPVNQDVFAEGDRADAIAVRLVESLGRHGRAGMKLRTPRAAHSVPSSVQFVWVVIRACRGRVSKRSATLVD